MKNKKNSPKLAKTYRCDTRTIRRWLRQKAPFDKPAAMISWLAARKTLPSGTREWLEEQQAIKRVASMARVEGSGPPGAVAALRRLEAAEAKAHAYWTEALLAGDPSEVKLARESWLKIGDSLRRYDLIIEKTRRETGELVQRKTVEDALAWLGTFWAWSIQTQVDSIASSIVSKSDEIPFVRRLLIERFDDNFLTTVAALAARHGKLVPEWVGKSLAKHQTGTRRDVEAAVAGRVEALAELFSLTGEAALQAVRRAFGLPPTRA